MNIVTEVKNLYLKFPEAKSLLFENLSVSFKEGENVLLLGPSGCGKSTLLQALSGLIPNSIEVPIHAEALKIPNSWGYVFQDPDTQFCMPYVDEEIAFVLETLQVPREEMLFRIDDLLKSVGLELSDPHTDINLLSGGMKQRLAIASCLALDPEVLFLDEPTAMLDPKGTKDVWDVISRVGRNRTLIIVEHKLKFVSDLIDRIILFDQKGAIIADGTKERIFSTYQNEFRNNGIWYPSAWEEYKRENHCNFQRECSSNSKRIVLDNFKGYLNQELKIHIPYADIRPGEWIAITGHNGAGKTTFLYALMQLIKTSGNYLLNGTPIESIPKITDHCAFVFQNPEYQFLTNSVYDEVAYSLRLEGFSKGEVDNRVRELLKTFFLEDKEKNHPYSLSIGQKRRLSVATSLVKEIPILLLDEPTFGLDAINTFSLLEFLERCRKKGMTILMCTHDLNITKHIATRTWVIEKGCLTKDIKSFDIR